MSTTIEDIRRELDASGTLDSPSSEELRDLLNGEDPYQAITVVGDWGLSEFGVTVAACLESDDPMVRWNAVSVLTTRLKMPDFAERVLSHADSEEDELVRAAALSGVGSIWGRVESERLKAVMGGLLLEVLEDENELPEMRGAAYEGLLSALGVAPERRPSAAEVFDFESDVNEEEIERFREMVKNE